MMILVPLKKCCRWPTLVILDLICLLFTNLFFPSTVDPVIEPEKPSPAEPEPDVPATAPARAPAPAAAQSASQLNPSRATQKMD